MNRLEKKCFVASASAHAALALLLFAAPWIWVAKQPELARPVLNLIPTRLLDGVMAGGGSPRATAPPAAAPAAQRPLIIPAAPVQPRPEPAPARPEPKPAKPESEPPAKSQNRRSVDAVMPDKNASKDPADDTGERKHAKDRIKLSFEKEPTGTSRKKQSAADGRGDSEASVRAAQAQYASRLNQVLGAIGQGLSSGTSFEVPGPGGETYADYAQWVVTVYYENWHPPNLADESLRVTAEVVILRNGTVQSFRVTKRSGHGPLDQSVELLKSVTRIERFPDGSTDEKRTFIIDFLPRTKR
jgi:outer membrane biosynthesis protein TonB